MMSDDRLPNLQDLAMDGSFLRMTSSLPSISSVAWASLFTGKNPGEFGVFGFEERRGNSDQTFIPDRRNLRSPTIFSNLESKGHRYVSINVPMTYPPVAGEGSVMVSSFLSPSIDRAASSPEVLSRITEMGYELDIPPEEMSADSHMLFARLSEIYARRESAVLHFLRGVKWDLFFAVFTENDRLSHFAFDEVGSKSSDVRSMYRMFDETIGRLRRDLSRDTNLVVFSDHGFCEAETELNLNRWLLEEGYLDLDEDGQRPVLSAMKPGSEAFALDSGRIYTNRHEDEHEPILDEISERLADLRKPSGNGNAIRRVWHNNEIYSGPYASMGPDLVVEPEIGVDIKTGTWAEGAFTSPRRPGMHLRDDAILLTSNKINESGQVHIQDVYGLMMEPLE